MHVRFLINISENKRNLHSVTLEGSNSDASDELSTHSNDNVHVVQNAREHKRACTTFRTINLTIMSYAFNYSQNPHIGTPKLLTSDLSVSEDESR